MFLIYFYKNGAKRWMRIQKEEEIERFVKVNEIEEYYITVDENGFDRMRKTIEKYEEQKQEIKRFFKSIYREEEER